MAAGALDAHCNSVTLRPNLPLPPKYFSPRRRIFSIFFYFRAIILSHVTKIAVLAYRTLIHGTHSWNTSIAAMRSVVQVSTSDCLLAGL